VHRFTRFDPLLPDSEADALVRLCERFGSYGMYSEERAPGELGAVLPQRYDAAKNFVSTGGRFARREPAARLAARTNYFRETYAYGEEIAAPGIEPFLRLEGFVRAARELYGRPVVVPAIVYANLLVPGQELAVHTDVPEFRGANRKITPQWLLVAMHHSGLFDDWRMPVATAVAWFHDCRGGEFAFWPDGPDAAPVALPVRRNTALLLDTDSVFHGVDRVSEAPAPLADLRPGMKLRFAGDGVWRVHDGERVVASYRFEDLRFSVSWKAYCFRDEAERRTWAEHRDDLALAAIVERLVADLRRQGVLGAVVPETEALARAIIDHYIRFPKPAAA
jgi:hypothetical protein